MEERLLGSEAQDICDLKGRVWEESKKMWKVGFPAMLTRASQFGMFVVTQAFIGHVGELELAGFSLVQIIAVRFGNGILVRILYFELHLIYLQTLDSFFLLPNLYQV